MRACGSEVETAEHFLLRFRLYSPQRLELFENLEKVDSSFLNLKVKEKVGKVWSWNYQDQQERLLMLPSSEV